MGKRKRGSRAETSRVAAGTGSWRRCSLVEVGEPVNSSSIQPPATAALTAASKRALAAGLSSSVSARLSATRWKPCRAAGRGTVEARQASRQGQLGGREWGKVGQPRETGGVGCDGAGAVAACSSAWGRSTQRGGHAVLPATLEDTQICLTQLPSLSYPAPLSTALTQHPPRPYAPTLLIWLTETSAVSLSSPSSARKGSWLAASMPSSSACGGDQRGRGEGCEKGGE